MELSTPKRRHAGEDLEMSKTIRLEEFCTTDAESVKKVVFHPLSL